MNNQSKQRVDDIDYTPNKVIVVLAVVCLGCVVLYGLGVIW